MFQIVFNAISAAEMSALPVELQLDMIAEFQILPENLDHLDPAKFGKVEHHGHTLHRCHAGDFRIYFERVEEGILIHRVLHKNTLGDFLYRSHLSLFEEDKRLGKIPGFWKLIEEGVKSGKEKLGEKFK